MADAGMDDVGKDLVLLLDKVLYSMMDGARNW